MLTKNSLSQKCINSAILVALLFLIASCQKDTSQDSGEIHVVVEEMPRITSGDCKGLTDRKEQKKCSDQALLKFIYENIKYPKKAKENGTEGMAVVSFVVTKEGDLTDIKVLRDPGDGCGKEAARVVNLMTDKQMWSPGKHKGKLVAVKYNIPVRFALGDGNSSTEKDEDGVYTKVEKMPYMQSDECNQADREQQKECGNQTLLKFLADNIQYPEEAKKNKTEGMAVVSFIVTPQGSITKVQIVKDLSDGCGNEAVRVVNLMSQQTTWVPGEKDGKTVAVKYNLPIRFKL